MGNSSRVYENSLYSYTRWDKITSVFNPHTSGHKLILSWGPGRNFLPEDIIVLRCISWEIHILQSYLALATGRKKKKKKTRKGKEKKKKEKEQSPCPGLLAAHLGARVAPGVAQAALSDVVRVPEVREAPGRPRSFWEAP